MFEKILENAALQTPLVHLITNYVTVNDCANAVLACGGSPIMADDIEEVEEITSICSSLVLNVGTLNQRTIASMQKAGKKANELRHPVILDPVGAGASTLRTQTTFDLLHQLEFSVIRGNISEIKTIWGQNTSTKGVDADVSDAINEENIDEAVFFAKTLSQKTGAIIAVTGKIDIVSDSTKAYVIRNGCASMSKVTGTGCMLSAIIGAYCGANPENILDACAAAVSVMGLSGELAQQAVLNSCGGTASLRTQIIDHISLMNTKGLNGGIKIESK